MKVFGVFTVCFLSIYLGTVLNFIKKRKLLWKQPPLPGCTAYPLIGHTHEFPSDTVQFWKYITGIADQMCEDPNYHSGLLWLGPVPVVLVAHPSAAEVILRTSKHSVKSFVYRFLLPWLGDGLLISKGSKWHTRRHLITPTFHFTILNDFLHVMNEQSQVMMKKIDETLKSGKSPNMPKRITLCALDIICETAMGQTVSAQVHEDSEYANSLYRLV